MIKAGVMGWPVEHSLSPKLHGFWLKKYGIDGTYVHLPVPPDEFETRLKNLGRDGFAGCNLTLPYKIRALNLMDDLSPRAQAIGAVNTVVVMNGGGLLGDNTDSHGFIQALNHQVPDWKQSVRRACIIGAGGAAKAVTYGLLEENIPEIALYNRTPEKAEAIASDLAKLPHPVKLYAYGFDQLQADIASYDLIVNTTSLGMKGQPPLQVDLQPCQNSAIVADIVYVPKRTELLKQAAALGLRTAGGLEMLVYQAAPGFEYWFDRHPEVQDDILEFMQAASGAAE